MGEVDIEKLNKIYSFANQSCRLLGLPFQFKEDSGRFETVIAINDDGRVFAPNCPAPPNAGWHTFVPDILDYINKIAIEFEETPGKPRHGAKLAKKGHDPDGLDTRTSNRDLYYSIAKLRVLKIFDFEFVDETKWRIKVIEFLIKCYRMPLDKTGVTA